MYWLFYFIIHQNEIPEFRMSRVMRDKYLFATFVRELSLM